MTNKQLLANIRRLEKEIGILNSTLIHQDRHLIFLEELIGKTVTPPIANTGIQVDQETQDFVLNLLEKRKRK
jgi:hypothetical protein